MSRQPVYTARGAAMYLGVCAFLMTIGGTVLYVSGEETLRCERNVANLPTCHLSRRVGPVTVRDLDLGVVTGADVLAVGGGVSRDVGRSSRQPESRAPSYAVRYHSEFGVVWSRAADRATDANVIRDALASFAADRAEPPLERTLPAASAKIAWTLFILGSFLAGLWTLGFLFPSLRSEI